MSSLITAVFKVTIGLLVNKGRDKLAEKLNEGDVTDQKFRGLIVREIDEIKSKLDGLARKDLLASISLFKEGIELLYEVFESARSSSEHREITAAATVGAEQFDIAKEIRKLELSSLDESATRKLGRAKRRFEEARLEAIKAFSNEALELPDRLLATQYRLMTTILETVDNPTDALAGCRVCLDELHQVPAVKEYFKVELEEGLRLRARFNKDERRQIIFSVCHANRVIYDVMNMLGSVKRWTLPYVETGKENVDPLRNERVVKALKKQGNEHCCLLWSFGQEGEEKHKLKEPRGIATNTKGQFLVADDGDKTVKVFDSIGKFDFMFYPQTGDAEISLLEIWDVATAGKDDKIFLRVNLVNSAGANEKAVQVFNKTADPQHKFPVRDGVFVSRLTVSSGKQRGKILLLTRWLADNVVDVHEPSGELDCSFGERVFKGAVDITATCDGRVMIVDSKGDSLYLFDVEGHQLGKFNIKNERDVYHRIACHPASDHVVLAGYEQETRRLTLTIYTVNGEFVRRIQLDEVAPYGVNGITVTMESHIAVAFKDMDYKGKVIVLG